MLSNEIKLKTPYMKSSVQKEIDMSGDLNHPNIMKYVFASTHQNTAHFFIKEWPLDLARVIEQEHFDFNIFDKRLAMQIFSQIIEGVKHIHSKDWTPCDLKPENILLSKDQIKFTDFGLGWKNAQEEVQGVMIGTRGYRCPEMNRLFRKNQMDIFAAGVILAQMIGGMATEEHEHLP